MNILGLMELLRRTKAQRQLLVSTHNERFGRLLANKLRPVEGDGRTIVIEFEDWSSDGPTVRQFDVPADKDGLRVAG